MKILITGGSGLLGQYLNLSLSETHEILTVYNSNAGNCNYFKSVKIDLRNFSELKKIIFDFQPDVIIHSAAITSALLDGSYTLNDYYQNNVIVTKNLAEISSQIKARMIYISTDLVYDGNRGSYLSENSKLNPASPYAESKLIGEEKVKDNTDDFVILRLALLIGFGLNHSRSHYQQVFENLKANKPVNLFVDQFRSPISLKEASKTIKKIIKLNIPADIYNLGGKDRLSRFSLGELLADKFNFDKSLLIPTKLADVIQVPKVKDVSLDINKLNSLGIEMASIEEMISETTFIGN